jgi:hypothetical protein
MLAVVGVHPAEPNVLRRGGIEPPATPAENPLVRYRRLVLVGLGLVAVVMLPTAVVALHARHAARSWERTSALAGRGNVDTRAWHRRRTTAR